MFVLQQRKSESRQIESHGLRISLISSLSDFDLGEFATADAIIISDLDTRNTGQVFSEIRRSNDKSVYLKPIFRLHDQNQKDIWGFDGSTDLVELEGLAIRTKSIQSKIQQVDTLHLPKEFERLGIFKTLAYLYTRDILLTPVPSREARIGYALPFVDQLFSEKSALEGVQLLKRSRDLGLTTSKLLDRVHNCSSCHGNYINFREVCPKCKSVNIKSKDLVHHFKCAHVDTIDKFQIEDGLQCPKCEQKLRHIGIDYDKPSSMYHCQDCYHEFQECDMLAFCIDCGQKDEASDLLENDINTYSITEEGEHVVRDGWVADDQNSVPNQKDQFLSLDLFKMMLKMEVQRSAAKSTSTFAKLTFTDQVIQPLGRDAQLRFQQEIIEIINSYLDKASLITSKSPAEYLLLLHDKIPEEAKETLELIEHNLLKLVADNLSSEDELIQVAYQAIDANLNPNLVL